MSVAHANSRDPVAESAISAYCMERHSSEEEVSSTVLQRSKGFQPLPLQISGTGDAECSHLQRRSPPSPCSVCWGHHEGRHMAVVNGLSLPSPAFRRLFATSDASSIGMLQQERNTASIGTDTRLYSPDSNSSLIYTAGDRCTRQGVEEWLSQMETQVHNKLNGKLKTDDALITTAKQCGHSEKVEFGHALVKDLPPPAFVLLGLLSPRSSAEHWQ